jgi:hypothetical protein
LFKFRALAGVFGIENTDIAVSMGNPATLVGSNGQMVMRSQAIKDKDRFYVDNEGDVWNRKYYDSIFENPVEEVA